ncbi:hypothetical protein LTR37_012481 [Vermiconidia calcicola]|uniref:Uncharacterized protein n=1 Tax=Vermiconidia calcicola TaxID=1690605 RepID=A0ACC3N1S4_9PEZI|nr:hypothetical protein LTR37_012481 [Vermiconidia calcicola]
MALTIQQLNADTTYVLTFSPPNTSCHRPTASYTVLVDPWLSGPSSILHPSFQISRHTSEPAISSLAEIADEINLIIISQDKPDHCHRETLCSLPKDSNVDILATPAAAKKIRSWKDFAGAQRVRVLPAYNASHPLNTVIKIPLPACSNSNTPGEVTIANIATKLDITGLHNAVGITYQPLRALHEPPTHRKDGGSRKANTDSNLSDTREGDEPLESRTDSGIGSSSSSACKSQDRILSVIYTPHGVYPRVLEPYINSYLRPLNALPVSALFHSINTEENPQLLGGRVAAGAPRGLELVKVTGAEHWIGAHDEVKDNRGVATTWIKSRKYDEKEVREMLREGGMGGTRVHRLGVGEVVRIVDGEAGGE